MTWKTTIRAVLAAGAVAAIWGPPAPAAAETAAPQPVLQLEDPRAQLSPDVEATPQLGMLSVGPDVTIIYLDGVDNYTQGGGSPCPPGYSGNCRGYAIGTDSCNIGSVPVDWCDETGGCRTTTDDYHPVIATNTDHSVIGQNLYRLKNGRFQQIGLSFLKHGFVATNSPDSACVWNDNGTPNTSCVQPPAGGDQLGVGCTDFYWAALNGARPMGRRSQVNAADADHPASAAGGETNDAYDQRIVVAEADLDPAQNPGALYWMEGQYVVRDDARSGPTASPPAPFGEGSGAVNMWLGENGHNNASYRAVTVGGLPQLNITMTGPTVRELSALYAWQAEDPEVVIVNADRPTFFVGDPVDPPGTGTHPDHWVVERFEAARRVSEAMDGITPYHYEYTIHNMNSDTAADGFVIDFPSAAVFANVGFHDIDHHSGEPYDTTDWAIAVDAPNGTITWSAADAGENTNALRWGTSFSFWFDSDQPPTSMSHALDLFKIDEMLPVPFETADIFSDGFESGDTSQWDQTQQ